MKMEPIFTHSTGIVNLLVWHMRELYVLVNSALTILMRITRIESREKTV